MNYSSRNLEKVVAEDKELETTNSKILKSKIDILRHT